MPLSSATLNMEGTLAISRKHRDLGVAKVARVDGQDAELEWFESVAEPAARQERVSLEDLIPWRPDRQSRVYFRDVRGWRVGRVVDEEFDRYCVRPPGRVGDVWLGIEDLYMRWAHPLADPVAVMQAVGMESPNHFHARHRFVASLLEQHAACRGISAIPSSAIELYDHQIEIAARVLSDPMQRYLLADEVGLGKTIEAGLIVRQRLLDDPECVVRIIVPQRIRRQWELELQQRFFSDDFLLAQVDVLTLEDAAAWKETPGLDQPDLLIVDEAHHVASWSHGHQRLRSRYAAAARLAHETPSLLLLSATPVAHHEATFLAMLHMLDPDNYRLDDLPAFRRRVEDRHELSRALVLFRPGQRLRRMVANADRLRDLLADDDVAIDYLDRILASDDETPREDLDQRIRALRSALSERHRIHHRMLRNRRDDVTDYPVRGRVLANRLIAAGPDEERLDAWVGRWQNALVEDGTVASGGHELVRVLLDRTFAFPGVLRAVASVRKNPGGDGDETLTSIEQDLLDDCPAGPAELEVIDALERLPIDDLTAARVDLIAGFVFDVPRRTKVVVFASYLQTAQLLVDTLTATLAPGQVARHLASDDLEATRAELRRFREERSCNVLICDASAEEGLNLQFADVLVHAELPFSPNRLEQRIGRLDRHGPHTPVENVVLTHDSTAGTQLDAWARCLVDGFAIFTRSVAAYQFVVDSVMPSVARELLEAGPVGLDALTRSLPERLDHERSELREQDQLDAIEVVEMRQPIAEALRGIDADWEEHEAAAQGLICEGRGDLRFARVPDYRDERLCTYWASSPIRGGEPLVPQSDVVDYLLGALSDQDRELLGSYSRDVALAHPGARVWRAGDRFLDGLLRYVRERDDRGRAYALWRHLHDWAEDEVVPALRFDFIIEPAIDPGRNEEALALRRRALAVLSPWIETVWIGKDLEQPGDPALVGRLRAKYSPAFGDERLGPDRWEQVVEVMRGVSWERWCADAHEAALAIVQERDSVTARTVDAREQALARTSARLGGLRGRSRWAGDWQATLAAEEIAGERVVESVATPRFLLDSMGFVVLAGRRRVKQ
jgi:ATP-dependent helicase HepA